jgi:hypothetical protein
MPDILDDMDLTPEERERIRVQNADAPRVVQDAFAEAMSTPDLTAFLAGLRVDANKGSVVTICDADGNVIGNVLWLSREVTYLTAKKQAAALVTAAHEYATWGKVIEAAKAFHEIDAVCRQNVREGRRAAAPIIMRDGAMDRLKSAIDAALAEEGSDATR